MSDYANNCGEAVPVKVNRVFDSCSDKDCITGIQVTLEAALPESATIIKSRCITTSDVCMTIEPIPFNKGFYSVDITFTFNVELAAYTTACSTPTIISGTASVSKNCILYGSETNSKTFSSDGSVIGTTGECCNTINPPVALVQAVSPLVLEAKIATVCTGCECGQTEGCTATRGVFLTIGLFYVVELVRPVTVMVQTYPYTIPQKECCCDTESPCEVFDRIRFPVEEFSPKKASKPNYTGGCGCGGISSARLNPPPLSDEISNDCCAD